MYDRATARRSCPSRALGPRARPRVGFVISAVRVLRPIQRQTASHKPFPKIPARNRTGRDRAAIPVEAERDTGSLAPMPGVLTKPIDPAAHNGLVAGIRCSKILVADTHCKPGMCLQAIGPDRLTNRHDAVPSRCASVPM